MKTLIETILNFLLFITSYSPTLIRTLECKSLYHLSKYLKQSLRHNKNSLMFIFISGSDISYTSSILISLLNNVVFFDNSIRLKIFTSFSFPLLRYY